MLDPYAIGFIGGFLVGGVFVIVFGLILFPWGRSATPEGSTLAGFTQLFKGIQSMTTAAEHLASALDTLRGSVASAASEIAKEAQALRDAHNSDDSAAVDAAASEIEAQAQALKDAVTAAEAPPPAPEPQVDPTV